MYGICKIRVPLSTPQQIPLELFKFQGDFHILIHTHHEFVNKIQFLNISFHGVYPTVFPNQVLYPCFCSPETNFSSLSALSAFSFWVTWAYTSRVVEMFEWPRLFCSVFTSTPASKSATA